MESRVAVLEQLAKDTHEAIVDLKAELRGMRTETAAELRLSRAESRTDFRWLLGIMLGLAGALLGAMAHGFHWL